MSDINLPGFIKHEEGSVPAHLQQSGRGNDNVTSNDVVVPKLNLIQALSPQVNSIGARPGQLHLTLDDELMDSVYVVNIMYDRTFNVFKKRQLGGGFFGIFDTRQDAEKAIYEANPSHADDYDIQETGTHSVLVLDDNGAVKTPARIYMSGSKLAVSNAWNSAIITRSEGRDRFASVWQLGTTLMKQNNREWFNFTVEFAGWCNEALYKEADQLYSSINATKQAQALASPEAA